jgi:hypothetical protein
MDNFSFFWGITLLIGLILFFGIPYLTYFTFKTLGKPRLGKVIGLVILTVFLLFTIYVTFEDYFFFKYSARKELKELDLILNDNFEIIKNESGGFKDYYHIFELKISHKDVERLIESKDLTTKVVTIRLKNFENNVWKEVKIDIEKDILTYEYIIN